MPAQLPIIDATQTLCCPPLGSERPTERDAEEIAARLRALADAGRVRILGALGCCDGHEMSTGDAATLLGVTEATASHHLKQLSGAGLVTSRRDGRRVLYALNREATHAVADAIDVRCSTGDGCC